MKELFELLSGAWNLIWSAARIAGEIWWNLFCLGLLATFIIFAIAAVYHAAGWAIGSWSKAPQVKSRRERERFKADHDRRAQEFERKIEVLENAAIGTKCLRCFGEGKLDLGGFEVACPDCDGAEKPLNSK